MRFNFRKISSVLASAVMIGSTIGIAAAASAYPAPFIAGGKADVAVVVGTSAASSDYLATIDVGQNLQAELAKQTATSTTTTASASGGDSVNLATSSQKLFMNSTLNAARTVLTKDNMPNVLADGSAYDSSGTEYKYTQKVTLPTNTGRQITFSKSGESIDPEMIVDTGFLSTAITTLYNYTLTFSKVINVSNSNVIGTATVKMQGVSYTIGANSDSNTLYLYGSGEATTVNGGETKTVTVDAKEHTVALIGTSSTTTASLEVDGSRKSVTKGSSYKYGTGSDQIEVYIKDIFHAVREADTPSIDVLVGARTLHFEDGQAVRYGADDTTILNTIAEVAGSGGTQLSGVSIVQGADSATGDYVKIGKGFVDRVLGGVEVQFAGVDSPLDSTTRDSVVVDTDNSLSASVKFTSYLAGTAGEKTITFAKDSDLVSDSTLNFVNLVNANNKTIHVLEGANATIGEWIVVNDNDEGRILEVVSLPAGTSSNDYIGVKDIITNEDYKMSTGFNNYTSSASTIGAGEYYANVTNGNSDSSAWSVRFKWGPGASYNTVGTQTTLYPRIKLKGGSWMSFLTNQSVNISLTYSLPGIYLWTTYRDGAVLAPTILPGTGSGIAYGSVIYNVTNGTGSSAYIDRLAIPNSCVFNKTMGPAILIQEEKTLRDTNGQSICIPLTRVGTTTIMPGISTPSFSEVGSNSSGSAPSPWSMVTKTSDTYTSQAIDLFGTLVERNVATGTNYKVTVKIPDDQMIADVLFTAKGATVTAGTTSGTGVTELGSVTVKDSEVAQVQTKNLLVLGGSCINTVAAKILGSDNAICGADFTAKTGVGADQALLKVVKNPYLTNDTTKVAMLVAGYEAADTTKAAKYLTTSKPSTEVGETKLSTSGTVATVATASTTA
ncbi:MAG TPA: hypothetical protein VJA86_00030 [Candidatus Nanoarchaeia archaeon]|nr:hypothetical protein [Candidatus Nanoarchaeia archaeon]